MRQTAILLTVLAILFPGPCRACLWDYDTLEMERQLFPEAHELIAGHFVRHSSTYYKWRIEDRTAKPTGQRTPSDYDDIAVAYDKLGEHDQAIETIEAKIERWPDEYLYESEANLGTFHIHAGRLEEGLTHITKAIEINPDAHFGREVYQKLLVEYLIMRRDEVNSIPSTEVESGEYIGFAKFVLDSRETNNWNSEHEIQSAVKGILGMMRFGNHESPILLEALGDLLIVSENASDSKMLATRAYLKASFGSDAPSIADAYFIKAKNAIGPQYKRGLDEIVADLKSEIAQGEEFFQRICENEQAWATAGKNLDAEFEQEYYITPGLKVKNLHYNPKVKEVSNVFVRILVVVILFIVSLAVVFFLFLNVIRKVPIPEDD